MTMLDERTAPAVGLIDAVPESGALDGIYGDRQVIDWDALHVDVYDRHGVRIAKQLRVIAHILDDSGVLSHEFDMNPDTTGFSNKTVDKVRAKANKNREGVTDRTMVVDGQELKRARWITKIVL